MPNLETLIAVLALPLAAWMTIVPTAVFIVSRNLRSAWWWYVTIVTLAVEVIMRLR